MKTIFCILLFLTINLSVSAGDVPETLLFENDAQIFFAEIVAYNHSEENASVTLLPTKKIKGDILLNQQLVYAQPVPVGDITIDCGLTYLFAYSDGNNPTYIFKTDSSDTKTLSVYGIEHQAMWQRFEKYLNDGEYEKAELERHNSTISQNQNEPKSKINILLFSVGVLLCFFTFIFIIKKFIKS